MTYCFQYFNVFPNGTSRTQFYSSKQMDGSAWSFSINSTEGSKSAFISLPIAGWKVKTVKLKGWKIKYSHQIVDHKKTKH